MVEHTSMGETVYNWEPACTTWAEIRGDVITIRYQSDLQPGYRVKIGEECLEIISVIDRPGKTRLVELTVKETLARESMPRAQWRWTATAKGFRQSGGNTGT
jgi:head-tail adaptor